MKKGKLKKNRPVQLIAILLVLCVALAVAKDVAAKVIVSGGVKLMTGLTLNIRSMNVGVLRTLIAIKDMKLYNPRGFHDKVMADIPELYVDYDLGAFLRKKVHFEKMKLHLKEFLVVKNEKGELNLDALKMVKAKKKTADKVPVAEKEKTKMPEMRIDVLELKIEKVIYKDYSRGTPPSVQEFEVNINERYEDITDPYMFGSLIVVKALMNTTIARLTNFDLGPLKTQATGALTKATGIATETFDKAKTQATEALTKTSEVGKEAAAKAGEAASKATDVAKDAAEKTSGALKKVFSFGGGGEE
ncbi:MAG: hypothetical protein ABH845_05720 [Candidatus Omnitrophota bacterium]